MAGGGLVRIRGGGGGEGHPIEGGVSTKDVSTSFYRKIFIGILSKCFPKQEQNTSDGLNQRRNSLRGIGAKHEVVLQKIFRKIILS